MFVNFLGSNAVLKLKFRKLQRTIVNKVDPVDIIDFLFEEAVISAADTMALQKSRDDPRQQCRDLLVLLHSSDHPQAFTQLYAAIKDQRHLHWLVDRVDSFSDQSLIDLIQQLSVSDTTGKRDTTINAITLHGLRLFNLI